MKIIGVLYEPEPNKKKQHFSDFVNVEVEYKTGVHGQATFTRARVHRLLFQEELQKRFGISDELLNEFYEKCSEDFQAEHFWDEDD